VQEQPGIRSKLTERGRLLLIIIVGFNALGKKCSSLKVVQTNETEISPYTPAL
jgi:hypothetical protein